MKKIILKCLFIFLLSYSASAQNFYIITPSVFMSDVPRKPLVMWRSVPGVLHYHIKALDTLRKKITLDTIVNSFDTTFQISESLERATYYVLSIKAVGDTFISETSTGFKTVNDQPPFKGEVYSKTSTDGSVSFSTTIDENANFHIGEWSEKRDFSSILRRDSTYQVNRQLMFFYGNLPVNKWYYFRTISFNAYGNSGYLVDSIFNKPFMAPVRLISPNNTSDVKLTPQIKWQKHPTALYYDLYISESNDTSRRVLVIRNYQDTTYQVLPGVLKTSTNYYLSLYAFNGTERKGVMGSFGTTANPAPVAPAATYPSDTITNPGSPLTFAWNTVPDAMSYCLQVSRDSLFQNITEDTCGLTTTTYTYNGNSQLRLEEETFDVFFWRVSAVNGSGQGVWSPVNKISRAKTVTGISEKTGPAGFVLLYPNPATDLLFINDQLPVTQSELRDAEGNTILKTTGNTISTGNMSKGVYILEIFLLNGTRYSERVFIK